MKKVEELIIELSKCYDGEKGSLDFTTPFELLVAVMISYFILGEDMTIWQIIGGLLILGFTLWNEITPKVHNEKEKIA